MGDYGSATPFQDGENPASHAPTSLLSKPQYHRKQVQYDGNGGGNILSHDTDNRSVYTSTYEQMSGNPAAGRRPLTGSKTENEVSCKVTDRGNADNRRLFGRAADKELTGKVTDKYLSNPNGVRRAPAESDESAAQLAYKYKLRGQTETGFH